MIFKLRAVEPIAQGHKRFVFQHPDIFAALDQIVGEE